MAHEMQVARRPAMRQIVLAPNRPNLAEQMAMQATTSQPGANASNEAQTADFSVAHETQHWNERSDRDEGTANKMEEKAQDANCKQI